MGISRKEALDYLQSDDLIGIGMEADAVRRRLHPEGVVTYTLDGRIDYTTTASGTTDFEPLFEKIAASSHYGGTSHHPAGRSNPGPHNRLV